MTYNLLFDRAESPISAISVLLMQNSNSLDQFFQDNYAHWQKLYHLALTLLGNSSEAEDAVQDVFVKAAEKYQQFEGRSSTYTWLVRILINHCHDLRRKKGEKAVSLNQMNDEGNDLADVRADLTKKIELSEASHRLIKRIEQLSDIYREVIVLRFFDDLSYADIAEVLSISEGTVKSRLNNARRILKGELTSSGFKEEDLEL